MGEYGQYVGERVTSFAAFVGGQLGTLYFSYDKLFENHIKTTIAFSGTFAVLALGLFANKKYVQMRTASLMELGEKSMRLEGLKRVSQEKEESVRAFKKANIEMKFYRRHQDPQHLEQALTAYNHAIALRPNNVAYLTCRAFCHMQLNNVLEAEKDLWAAKALPPLRGLVGDIINRKMEVIKEYVIEQTYPNLWPNM